MQGTQGEKEGNRSPLSCAETNKPFTLARGGEQASFKGDTRQFKTVVSEIRRKTANVPFKVSEKGQCIQDANSTCSIDQGFS